MAEAVGDSCAVADPPIEGEDGIVPELTFPPSLDDGVIGLRPFRPTDLPAFEAAAEPGGNDGFWLTLSGADPQQCLANYLAGQPNPNDPDDLALAIVATLDDMVVGDATFIIRAEDSVELVYGVAPKMRRQGVATRAAKLASDWLLNHAGWGRVRTWVPSAGREFEDQLYLQP
ncbi:MAG: GNAT family N-acetyltransferase [Nocardioidaceae bacterium]